MPVLTVLEVTWHHFCSDHSPAQFMGRECRPHLLRDECQLHNVRGACGMGFIGAAIFGKCYRQNDCSSKAFLKSFKLHPNPVLCFGFLSLGTCPRHPKFRLSFLCLQLTNFCQYPRGIGNSTHTKPTLCISLPKSAVPQNSFQVPRCGRLLVSLPFLNLYPPFLLARGRWGRNYMP